MSALSDTIFQIAVGHAPAEPQKRRWRMSERYHIKLSDEPLPESERVNNNGKLEFGTPAMNDLIARAIVAADAMHSELLSGLLQIIYKQDAALYRASEHIEWIEETR